MFKRFRFDLNAAKCKDFANQLAKAHASKDTDLANFFYKKTLSSGRKALELSRVLKDVPETVSGEIEIALNELEKLYNSPHLDEIEPDNLRHLVKRQFIELNSSVMITGRGRVEDYVAYRMIKPYEIAERGLDTDIRQLKKIYSDNFEIIKPLRDVITQYTEGLFTKEQTTEKLNGLMTRTILYLQDLGADQNRAKVPINVIEKELSLEDKLKCVHIANSMDDEGKVDHKLFFMSSSKYILYNNWEELSEELNGREPTSSELIDAQINAYQINYLITPSNWFRNERAFNKWLNNFEKTMKSQGEDYFKAALPIYDALINNS